MPTRDVFPCTARDDRPAGDTALFGLRYRQDDASADPERRLIGDDEHG